MWSQEPVLPSRPLKQISVASPGKGHMGVLTLMLLRKLGYCAASATSMHKNNLVILSKHGYMTCQEDGVCFCQC